MFIRFMRASDRYKKEQVSAPMPFLDTVGKLTGVFSKTLWFSTLQIILLPRSKLSSIAETCKSDELFKLCSLFLSGYPLPALMFFWIFFLLGCLLQFSYQMHQIRIVTDQMQIVIKFVSGWLMIFVGCFFSRHFSSAGLLDYPSAENVPLMKRRKWNFIRELFNKSASQVRSLAESVRFLR